MTDDPSRNKNMPPIGDLSRRDQALARVADIMSEGRTHRPRPAERELMPEPAAEPINIEEVAGAAPQIGSPKPVRRPSPVPVAQALPEKTAVVEKKRGSALHHWFFQTLILLFVLIWVFILGIFIGRGYVMESAAGRELIGWLEEKMGRQPGEPEISIENFVDAPAAESVPAPAPEAAEQPPVAPPAVEPQENEPPEFAAPEENAVLKTVVNAAQSVGSEAVPAPSSEAPSEPRPNPEPEDDSIFLTPETLEETPPAPEPAAPAVYIPPPPDAPPVSNSGPGYAVQATYALNQQAAQAVVDRLKRQGFQAYFYVNSRGQYLIRVGRFANIEEAGNARAKLTALGYKDPYISRLEAEDE